MKRKMIYAALAVLALSAPAAAQGYGPGGLPPHEILTILRSTGLDPLGQPMRRGPNYVLRAIDERDREVSVVVSARSGDVLSVTPVQTASRMPPPRGGLTLGPLRADAAGLCRRRAGYRAGSPVDDDDDEPSIVENPNAPRPPVSMPGAPPMRSSNAAPLPPRSGAIAAARCSAAVRAERDHGRSRSQPACCRRRRSVSRSARRRPRHRNR